MQRLQARVTVSQIIDGCLSGVVRATNNKDLHCRMGTLDNPLTHSCFPLLGAMGWEPFGDAKIALTVPNLRLVGWAQYIRLQLALKLDDGEWLRDDTTFFVNGRKAGPEAPSGSNRSSQLVSATRREGRCMQMWAHSTLFGDHAPTGSVEERFGGAAETAKQMLANDLGSGYAREPKGSDVPNMREGVDALIFVVDIDGIASFLEEALMTHARTIVPGNELACHPEIPWQIVTPNEYRLGGMAAISEEKQVRLVSRNTGWQRVLPCASVHSMPRTPLQAQLLLRRMLRRGDLPGVTLWPMVRPLLAASKNDPRTCALGRLPRCVLVRCILALVYSEVYYRGAD